MLSGKVCPTSNQSRQCSIHDRGIPLLHISTSKPNTRSKILIPLKPLAVLLLTAVESRFHPRSRVHLAFYVDSTTWDSYMVAIASMKFWTNREKTSSTWRMKSPSSIHLIGHQLALNIMKQRTGFLSYFLKIQSWERRLERMNKVQRRKWGIDG